MNPTMRLAAAPARSLLFRRLQTRLGPAVSGSSVLAARPSVAIRASSPIQTQLAEFHSSRKQSILPPLPQSIQGTVNDAVKVPTPSPSHGSYHWISERVVAASLVPLTMVPFVAGSVHPLLDGALGALVIIHCHIGFQSCIVDYFPAWRVPKTFRALSWLLNGFSALVLYAFYEFETSDVGLTEGVRRIWSA